VFVAEAYKHAKPIAATREGVDLIAASLPEGAEWQTLSPLGVVTQTEDLLSEKVAQAFLTALAKHRHFGQPGLDHFAA
jgi:catalase